MFASDSNKDYLVVNSSSVILLVLSLNSSGRSRNIVFSNAVLISFKAALDCSSPEITEAKDSLFSSHLEEKFNNFSDISLSKLS